MFHKAHSIDSMWGHKEVETPTGTAVLVSMFPKSPIGSSSYFGGCRDASWLTKNPLWSQGAWSPEPHPASDVKGLKSREGRGEGNFPVWSALIQVGQKSWHFLKNNPNKSEGTCKDLWFPLVFWTHNNFRSGWAILGLLLLEVNTNWVHLSTAAESHKVQKVCTWDSVHSSSTFKGVIILLSHSTRLKISGRNVAFKVSSSWQAQLIYLMYHLPDDKPHKPCALLFPQPWHKQSIGNFLIASLHLV